MAKFDDLPADQRAAIRLALSGRNYSEIADALAIRSASVESLARDAATALAGTAAMALTSAEQARLADWITGAVEDEPLAQSSPAGMAFVDAVHSELAGIEGIALRDSSRPSAAATGSAAKTWHHPASVSAPASAQDAAPAASPAVPTGRKAAAGGNGGYVLIGLAVAAVLVGGLAIAGVFSGSDSSPQPNQSTTPTQEQKQGGTTPSGWKLTRRFTLAPVAGTTGAGIAAIETNSGRKALLLAGTNMKPSGVVGIWLTGGPSPLLVGFQKVSGKGEFSAIGALPTAAGSADRLIVTAEAVKPGQKPPASPGPVLLTSPFSLQ